ncbi:MAG TPA: glycosyltransferase family 39 protein [Candidatus Hydrogenedentes bacterium]|nr:glycosyltransferase family 39 protein [Candidatus Hydrogenedentota bacterium]HOS01697.1 glycosyltransferase family 39 protein [Candidatus Hydrogenedentota bacterium]
MSFCVLALTAAILGNVVLRPFRLGVNVEGLTFRFFAGLFLWAAIALPIASVSVEASLYALYAVSFALLSYELFGRRSTSRRAAAQEEDAAPPFTPMERVAAVTTACALLASFISALAPVTSWDAGVAHLALPAAYVRLGHMTAYEGNAYSAYPHLMHTLFTMAYFGGGERAAALLSWLTGVGACGATYALGRLLDGRRAGLFAAAIMASAPIFIDQAGTVSIDLACAGAGMAALAAIVRWNGNGLLRWLALAGFLAGSACGIRHTGFVMAALMAAGVFACARGARLRASFVFIAFVAVASAPWIARSAALTHNPVYPFFTQVFTSRVLPDAEITSVGTHESIRHAGLKSLVMFPWDIVMRPQRYDGWLKSPGALVLLLGAPGIFVCDRRTRMIAAYAIAGGLGMFFFRHLARYLLPFFAPMMVVAAVAACRLDMRRLTTGLLLLAFAFGLAVDAATISFKLPVVFGRESRDAYLTRRVERYPAFRWIGHQSLAQDRLVLTLDMRSYYIDAPTYQNFEAVKQLPRKRLLQQVEWLRARRIGYVMIPWTYAEEAPGFYATGVLEMLRAWSGSPRYFTLLKRFEMPRRDGPGKEIVEFFEVRYDT